MTNYILGKYTINSSFPQTFRKIFRRRGWVDHDDDVRTQFGSSVQTLKSLSARERTVADDGDDVLLAAKDVAALLQTCCQGNGGGGSKRPKMIVNISFLWER